jgi:hypothetical protein
MPVRLDSPNHVEEEKLAAPGFLHLTVQQL